MRRYRWGFKSQTSQLTSIKFCFRQDIKEDWEKLVTTCIVCSLYFILLVYIDTPNTDEKGSLNRIRFANKSRISIKLSIITRYIMLMLYSLDEFKGIPSKFAKCRHVLLLILIEQILVWDTSGNWILFSIFFLQILELGGL